MVDRKDISQQTNNSSTAARRVDRWAPEKIDPESIVLNNSKSMPESRAGGSGRSARARIDFTVICDP